MNNSIKYVTLDLQDICFEWRVDVRKGDNKKQIDFLIEDGGKPYEITGGCSVTARLKDGSNIRTIACTVDDDDPSHVILDISDYTTTSQVMPCELVITEGTDKLTTPNFNIYVWDAIS